MHKPRRVLRFLLVGALAEACSREKAGVKPGPPAGATGTASGGTASGLVLAPDIPDRLRRLARTPIDYDRALLDAKETRVVEKLIEASAS